MTREEIHQRSLERKEAKRMALVEAYGKKVVESKTLEETLEVLRKFYDEANRLEHTIVGGHFRMKTENEAWGC